jgi:hypothetical protein
MKYKLNCSKCNLDQIHETESMDILESFWKDWNKHNGEDMKCVHDYKFTCLDWLTLFLVHSKCNNIWNS